MLSSVPLAPLIALLGSDHVRTDEDSRRRGVSAWAPTVLKARQMGEVALPIAAVFPGTVDEVAALAEWCHRQRLSVIPVGGASSLRPFTPEDRPWLALMTERLQELSWDEESLLVTLGAGMAFEQAEETLNRHGYTLGHFPRTLRQSTVGGAVATNAIGWLSGKYGRIRDLTAGVEIVRFDGSIVRTDPAPGANTRFDGHDLLIGSEGAFGVVTSATLRMSPLPEARAFAVFSFPDFETGTDAARLIYRSDARPAALRLLDRASAAALADVPALLLMAFEGDEIVQTGHYQLAYAVCQEIGGTPLGPEIGDRWFERRYDVAWAAANGQPGTVVDLAAFTSVWSKSKGLFRSCQSALAGRSVQGFIELCHPSPNGSLLEIRYRTDDPDGDPANALRLHAEVTDRLTEACRSAGGSPVHPPGLRPTGDFGTAQENAEAAWKRLFEVGRRFPA
ncbi:MAG: FAD-binding oxidoreductase [Capsulimonadales bacterium]|nr:FAD-binding oxidoreductase [Capsulimonadales bacterium]